MAMKRRRGRKENGSVVDRLQVAARDEIERRFRVNLWSAAWETVRKLTFFPQTTFTCAEHVYIYITIKGSLFSLCHCGERKKITQWHSVSHFHTRSPMVVCREKPCELVRLLWSDKWWYERERSHFSKRLLAQILEKGIWFAAETKTLYC